MPSDREPIKLRDERTLKRIVIAGCVIVLVPVGFQALALPWWAVIPILLAYVIWLPMFFFPPERGWRRRAE